MWPSIVENPWRRFPCERTRSNLPALIRVLSQRVGSDSSPSSDARRHNDSSDALRDPNSFKRLLGKRHIGKVSGKSASVEVISGESRIHV